MTMYLINAQTVGSGGVANVTFNSIPQTYTDLKLVVSSRENFSGAGPWGNLAVTFNGNTADYSEKAFYKADASSGAAASTTTTGGSLRSFYSARNDATANVFSNAEMYIPNYKGTSNKSMIYESIVGDNSASAWIVLAASGFWANGAAITSINIASYNSVNLLQNSTFFLYGIKNS